jgi:hypothetical protein
MTDFDLDGLAIQQIQRLLHTRDCTVGDLVPAPALEGAVAIQRADGTIIAYARPAV